MMTNQDLLIELLHEELHTNKDVLAFKVRTVRRFLEEDSPGSTEYFDTVLSEEAWPASLDAMRQQSASIVEWFNWLYRRAT